MFILTDIRIAVATHPFIFLPFLSCLKAVYRIFFWTKCLKFSSIFSISTNSGANTTSAQGFSVMVPFLSIFLYNWAGSQKSFKFGQRVFVMNKLGSLSQFETGKYFENIICINHLLLLPRAVRSVRSYKFATLKHFYGPVFTTQHLFLNKQSLMAKGWFA